MSEHFVIKTQVFEGPLDVLLDLIEKRKLLINEISLASVTDEFIKFIENTPIEIHKKTEFIVIASTLLLIKSRSLLPNMNLADEDEMSIDDLEKRLSLYKPFKELGETIKKMYGKHRIFFPNENDSVQIVFSPHQSITIGSIHSAIKEALKRVPKEEVLDKISVNKVISIEEMIEKLSKTVSSALSMSFKNFSGHKEKLSRAEKVEVIVGFLAMLELVKQGAIDVLQSTTFGDIKMEAESVGTPRY